MTFRLGIATWGERAPHPDTGELPSPREGFLQLTELARTADRVGLDIVAVGEGHGAEHVNPDPLQLLAALSSHAPRVTLCAAASVLTTVDPVRVTEQLRSLGTVSGGRAELVAGQGGTDRDLRLFGVDPLDQEQIFEERLDQLLELLAPGPTDLAGVHRPEAAGVTLPPPVGGTRETVWAASSGSPRSVLRAAGHGIGVMLNVMEARWDQLVPYVKAYREALRGFRHSTRGAVGLLLPGLVVSDDDDARSPDALTLAYPYFAASTRTFGAASADDPAWTPEEFREQCGPEGALLVGGVSDVVTKLRAMRETLELDRVLVRVDVDGLPHDAALRTVELLGREVLPALR